MGITQEMIQYCNSTEPTSQVTEPAGFYPRPVKQIWDYEWGKIQKDITYINPWDSDENGLILNETYKWLTND